MITPVACVGCDAKFEAKGKCVEYVDWSAPGGNPSTGTGKTFKTKWTTIGTKTVSAVCGAGSSSSGGAPKTATVTIVEIDKVIVDGSDPEDTGPVDVIAGTTVAIRATRNPLPKDGAFPPGKPLWDLSVADTNDPGAYLRLSGPWSGPVLYITGFVPPGVVAPQNFTEIANCCDSQKTIQIVLHPSCTKLSFVSASNGFVQIANTIPPGLINVVGVKRAAGQKTTLTVAVSAGLDPSQVSWEGATVVPGSNNLQATVPVDTAVLRIVKVKYSNVLCKEIWVWPIWVDLEVKIAGSLDPDNHALNVNATAARPFGWQDRATRLTDVLWQAGGTSLGTIDHYATPNYKHGITGGKVEIVGTVKPEFVWNNINLTFAMKRNVVLEKYWDNGQHCTNPEADTSTDPNTIVCAGDWEPGPGMIANTGDSSNSDNTDLTPRDSGGKIFDLDVPACPPQFGFSIQHTAEAYMNFVQWATVNWGDGPVKCSDDKNWSYKARIDGDKKMVVVNELSHTHIPETEMISQPF